jgi:hypothetical protein
MLRKAAGIIPLFALVALGACGSSSGDDGEAADTGPTCAIADRTDAKATAEVHVTLAEWTVKTDVASVAAGNVRVVATNAGERDHEVVLVRGASPNQLTITADGLDEKALPAGAAVVGEIEGFDAGAACSGTFALTPGTYSLVCNLVDLKPHTAHAQRGMVTGFTVS